MIRTIFAPVTFLVVGAVARTDYTYRETVNEHSTSNYSGVVGSLASFNTSLGSLQSVTLSEMDGLATQGIVTNKTNAPQTSLVAVGYGNSTLFSDSLSASQTFTNLAPNSSALFGGFSPSGVQGPLVLTSGNLFNAFNQTNQTLNFDFAFNAKTSTNSPNNVTTQIFGTNQTNLFVTFDYSVGGNVGIPGPPSVPEPSSAVMFLIGGDVAFFKWRF